MNLAKLGFLKHEVALRVNLGAAPFGGASHYGNSAGLLRNSLGSFSHLKATSQTLCGSICADFYGSVLPADFGLEARHLLMFKVCKSVPAFTKLHKIAMGGRWFNWKGRGLELGWWDSFLSSLFALIFDRSGGSQGGHGE